MLRPVGFGRQPEIGDITEKHVVAVSYLPAAADEFCEALQLLPTDCRLDIGHPIVIAEFRIGLEDYLVGPMAHGVWHGHGMLPPQAKPGIPVLVFCRDHSSIAGGEDLPGMKGETGRIPMGLADSLPFAVPQDLAPDGAGSVFDQRQTVLFSNWHKTRKITRHADLMHAQKRAGPSTDGSLDQAGSRLNVSGLMSTKTGFAPQ